MDKDTIRRFLALGLTKKGLAHTLEVCRQTLYRWLNNSKTVLHDVKMGRPSKMNQQLSSSLLSLICENPFQSQVDMAHSCWITTGVKVHQTTISRFLKKVKWTRKKVTRRPDIRTEQRVTEWLKSLDGVNIEDLLALDETAFDTTQVQNERGYSPKGTPCLSQSQPTGRIKRERLTLLVCIYPGTGQAVHHKIVKGSMTGTLFQEFIATLPSQCQGKRLLLDNAPIHHATHVCRKSGLPTIQETGRSKDIQLHYLPPYSPQFNPTELVFARLKRCIRYDPSHRVTAISLQKRILDELKNLGDVRALFEHCLPWLR